MSTERCGNVAQGPETEVLPQLEPAVDPYEAARDAHCLVAATDWEEFKTLDLSRLREALRYPVIVDAATCSIPLEVHKESLSHYPVGRQPLVHQPRVRCPAPSSRALPSHRPDRMRN